MPVAVAAVTICTDATIAPIAPWPDRMPCRYHGPNAALRPTTAFWRNDAPALARIVEAMRTAKKMVGPMSAIRVVPQRTASAAMTSEMEMKMRTVEADMSCVNVARARKMTLKRVKASAVHEATEFWNELPTSRLPKLRGERIRQRGVRTRAARR